MRASEHGRDSSSFLLFARSPLYADMHTYTFSPTSAQLYRRVYPSFRQRSLLPRYVSEQAPTTSEGLAFAFPSGSCKLLKAYVDTQTDTTAAGLHSPPSGEQSPTVYKLKGKAQEELSRCKSGRWASVFTWTKKPFCGGETFLRPCYIPLATKRGEN